MLSQEDQRLEEGIVKEYCLQARAKVNLTVDVLRRRADGYHDVDLLMQSVSLCDTIRLREAQSLELTIEGALRAEKDNLILRAARLLAEEAGIAPRAELVLEKHVPVAAGLGGGSGDAAAALVGLNELWNLHYPLGRLQELGARLGADVPFCIAGGCQRATGIGTDLAPVRSRLPLYLVILKPCEGLLTKEIFEALDMTAVTAHPDTAGAARAMEAGSVRDLIACMGNVLETVAVVRRPAIARAIEELLARGALHARMSGSGSAVFGLFPAWEQAVETAVELKRVYSECCAAQSVDAGVKFL